MAEAYIAEIRMFGCNFPTKNWAQCNGQLLSIAQNTALFSLLGTYYGGDGKTTFALPNLQGAGTMHWGQGPGLSPRDLGESGGEPTVTLTTSQMPSHNHLPAANTNATAQAPAGNVWGNPAGRPAPMAFANAAGTPQPMGLAAVGMAGNNVAHNNLMPYQVMNYCICLMGIFPPRP